MLQLRDAALQLGISFPTLKQWIYKNKLRSVRTAGGHHRIPQSEVDKLLFRTVEDPNERGRTSSAGSADAINWWDASIPCASAVSWPK
ncbi:MAG TPA: excisionase family DNA-binding protein [Candidatus Sulfotelmatobacter sp.]